MDKGTVNAKRINRKRILVKCNDRFSEQNKQIWERRNKINPQMNSKKGNKENG